jgi:hypothetical protein
MSNRELKATDVMPTSLLAWAYRCKAIHATAGMRFTQLASAGDRPVRSNSGALTRLNKDSAVLPAAAVFPE